MKTRKRRFRKTGFLIPVVAIATVIGIASPAYAQTPPVQIATAQGSSSLCINRGGGGTAFGTSVIGYNCGNVNNDFEFGQLVNMCNHGKVSRSPACPFTNGSGLNAEYDGAAIVEIEVYLSSPVSCVGDDGHGTGGTILEVCPDSSGNNGGYGTIFVLSQVYDFANDHTYPTYAVNRYWSNNAYVRGDSTPARWLCQNGYRNKLNENSSSGTAGSCQWRPVY